VSIYEFFLPESILIEKIKELYPRKMIHRREDGGGTPYNVSRIT